jgi:hypothetical protein
LPRAFGVLSVEAALGGSPRLLFEDGGPRFGSGPRLGRGPVVGTRTDCEEVVGNARRFEGATRGGGMRDVVGLEGGAMRYGLLGDGMAIVGACDDARCAEFIAGNEGGGRLSSSSSSELSCSLSVKVGTAGASCSFFGIALGVDSGDGLCGETIVGSCFVRLWSSLRGCSAGVTSSVLPSCDLSGIVLAPDCVRRVMKASHVDGGRW